MFSRVILRQSRSIIRSRLQSLSRPSAITTQSSSPVVTKLPPSTSITNARGLSTTSTFHSTPSTTPMAAETDTAAAQFASSEQITPESLSATLSSELGATHLDIQDMSGGCGQAFTALIVSPKFEGKTLLARQRLVNGVLKEEIRAIHAWSPRCLTPEQWEKEKEKEKLAAQ